MKCVFFGSPDFALGSLEALLASQHKVVGVVTQPDRPAGRGLKLEPPPVKSLALKHNLPVHQPEKVNDESTLRFLSELRPDILAVVAYGGFLGAKLLQFCRFAPVNVHPSLLPELRGAAPVQWALLRGFRRTGVTTQFMVKEMDAGDVLLQEEFPIEENDTAAGLLARFSREGGRMLVRTFDQLEAGTLAPRPQNSAAATFAPLLTKENGLIHFKDSDAWTVHNQARGLYPWPGAYSFHQGKRVKILRTAMTQGISPRGTPGSFWIEGERMLVTCSSGVIEVLELQPEGRRAMLPREFESGIKGTEAPHHFDPTGG